ncbi:hypothetical protein [uncultured Sphingomonas sp.]|nr:hypothetical protein [uncultured Sphingomonas sp.]
MPLVDGALRLRWQDEFAVRSAALPGFGIRASNESRNIRFSQESVSNH